MRDGKQRRPGQPNQLRLMRSQLSSKCRHSRSLPCSLSPSPPSPFDSSTDLQGVGFEHRAEGLVGVFFRNAVLLPLRPQCCSRGSVHFVRQQRLDGVQLRLVLWRHKGQGHACAVATRRPVVGRGAVGAREPGGGGGRPGGGTLRSRVGHAAASGMRGAVPADAVDVALGRAGKVKVDDIPYVAKVNTSVVSKACRVRRRATRGGMSCLLLAATVDGAPTVQRQIHGPCRPFSSSLSSPFAVWLHEEEWTRR